jgi:membrane-associated protein
MRFRAANASAYRFSTAGELGGRAGNGIVIFGFDLPAVDVLAYLTVFAMAALDVFLPVLPADGTIIAAGALTVNGQLHLPLVFLAGFAGAWTGDVACYHVGRRLLRFRPGGAHRRPPASAPMRRVAVLRAHINRSIPELFEGHPSMLLAMCRLIPGGRTAGALAAGRFAFSRRRFAAVQLGVAAVWAGYETLLGYLSGRLLPAGVHAGFVLPAAELVLFVITFTIGARLWRALMKRRAAAAAQPPSGGQSNACSIECSRGTAKALVERQLGAAGA